jgi:crotonobetainyl-CoA:carnitine CoA-transferase CaiB-like acyl-CoA transferase
MKRFGLSYDDVKQVNPKVVYCSVSGFGQTGPNNKRPTVDGLIQAFTGMMVMNRTADGTPHRQGMIAVDVLTGLYTFQALSTAVMRQFRFGKGCYIDSSLMTAAAAFQGAKLMEYVFSNGNPPPLYTPAGMYKTKDGYMVISAMRPNHFRDLFVVLDRKDIADDPRLQTHADRIKNGAAINKALVEIMPGKTTAEWLPLLQGAGIFCERVNNYQDYLDHPHVKAVGAIDWAEIPGAGNLPVANIPGLPPAREDSVQRTVPAIGEHGEAILGAIGYTPERIKALYRAKALFYPTATAKAAE